MKQDQPPLLEMAEQMRKNYEQALRSGLKVQEEMLQRWNQSLAQVPLAQQWQKHFAPFTTVANSARPSTQIPLTEVLNLMQKSTQVNAELMQKAVEATQSTLTPDSQAKWMEFWQMSLGVAQSNTQALMQINTRAMDLWMDFARQNGH